MSTSDSLSVLVVGAHPDDCDVNAGGVAALWAAAAHDVRFLSMTDGSAGHHELDGPELARRRRREAAAAADAVGVEYRVLDHPDGELEPTLPARKDLIRRIRRFDPDLLLTHRPNDYHPDHRNASRLVRDSAYMVRVPNVCPETPALDDDPVIAYLEDDFERPYEFDPDVVVPVDDAVETKLDVLDCHRSQVYEWLPWVEGESDAVPPADDPEGRRAFLRDRFLSDTADRFRDRLVERYGEAGRDVEHAEAFEGSEYGAPLTAERVPELFPVGE
jgi:LmbE family N-acetylglucosaminyl deacetylase